MNYYSELQSSCENISSVATATFFARLTLDGVAVASAAVAEEAAWMRVTAYILDLSGRQESWQRFRRAQRSVGVLSAGKNC